MSNTRTSLEAFVYMGKFITAATLIGLATVFVGRTEITKDFSDSKDEVIPTFPKANNYISCGSDSVNLGLKK